MTTELKRYDTRNVSITLNQVPPPITNHLFTVAVRNVFTNTLKTFDCLAAHHAKVRFDFEKFKVHEQPVNNLFL